MKISLKHDLEDKWRVLRPNFSYVFFKKRCLVAWGIATHGREQTQSIPVGFIIAYWYSVASKTYWLQLTVQVLLLIFQGEIKVEDDLRLPRLLLVFSLCNA